MCQELEEIYNEGEQSGVQKGELKKARETALTLLDMGMSSRTDCKSSKSFYRNYSELDI